LTILEEIIDRLLLIRLVWTARFGSVALLALLAINLISVKALHRFFLELIEARGAIESSESDIYTI